MSVVMKLLAWADGQPLRCAGEYVRTLDVQAASRDLDWLTTTPDIALALRWPDPGAARRQWKEILKSDPVRADGKPNRPMTALTIQLVRVLQ